ncbi:hypothetical protein F5Y05DRAFT_376532 [Hypoxylon sp. FL0543]|nr:hypothetical protein F5Y05DRAFT_376532 [Hypoxylon sp. FL0543]
MASSRTELVAGTSSPPRQITNERRLLNSCEDFLSYPCNLAQTLIYEHMLESYRSKLLDESERLFNPIPEVKLLRFWETNVATNGFREYRPPDFESLKRHCQCGDSQDPACRYVFIQSKHSRARLELTQQDLTYLLSYHQVMPHFLDLLFTCGRQEKLQDFHYTAFHHENYLHNGDSNSEDAFKIERIGRSGRQIQQCYNLHSVERTRSEWGWSIRQTVVYHSFDVETGKSFWIFIKGNNTIEERISKATYSRRSKEMAASSHQTVTGSFDASLATHTHLMEWCGEQWRWYINEMEDRLRNKAKIAVLADVDHLAGPAMVPAPSRPGTFTIPKSSRATLNMPSPTSLKRLRTSFTRFSSFSRTEKSPTIEESNIAPPIQTDNIVEEPEEMDGDDGSDDTNLERMFSFEKLQDLHQTGEYMQEALMVLKQNRNVIKDIREYYTTMTESEGVPSVIREGCSLQVAKFSQRILSIEKDLEVQQSRLETLNILLSDRSSLFYSVQQYTSMQASKHFAKNAQASTDFTVSMTAEMNHMTEKMHDIALKTSHQTVSMHVITVFTLLFLPGTFLATFFSSGILRWHDSEDGPVDSNYSWDLKKDRLSLYIKIGVPMMVLIIVGWLVLYFKSKAQKKEEEKGLRMLNSVEEGLWASPMGGESKTQSSDTRTPRDR